MEQKNSEEELSTSNDQDPQSGPLEVGRNLEGSMRIETRSVVQGLLSEEDDDPNIVRGSD
jgi:hypothetical protein